jgi:hypothetical protein
LGETGERSVGVGGLRVEYGVGGGALLLLEELFLDGIGVVSM